MRADHRTWLAGAAAALALACIPLSFHAERRLETAMHMEGAESQEVAEELSAAVQRLAHAVRAELKEKTAPKPAAPRPVPTAPSPPAAIPESVLIERNPVSSSTS